MNKSELIDALAARFEGNRKAAAHALEAVLDTITREVARGEKVAITGFGSFERRIREAREVRNPATGERLISERIAIPKFSAGAGLKDVVAGLRELPQRAYDTAAAAMPGGGRRSSAADQAPTRTASAPDAKPSAEAPAPAPAQKTTARKSTTKKATTKKAAAQSSTPAKKTTAATKTTAKKTATAKKTTAAKKTSAAKKTAAKKTAAKKTAAKKTSGS